MAEGDDEIEWLEGNPVDESLVMATERNLGVVMPLDYRMVVLQNNEARPSSSRFKYWDPNAQALVGTLCGRLLSVNPDSSDGVMAVVRWLEQEIPATVIPVAGDGAGNFICIDYRGAPPSIVFWDHERDFPESIIPLAPSFRDFVSMLMPRRKGD